MSTHHLPRRERRVSLVKHVFLASLLVGLSVTSNSVHAQLPSTGIYEPGAEGEIWRFIGSVGSSYKEACAAAGYDPNTSCWDYPVPLADDALFEPQGFDVWEPGPIEQYRVFIADRWNSRVAVFDFFGEHVLTVDSFAGESGPDSFNVPESVTLDGAGNIIVSDTGNERVLVFNNAFVYQFAVPMVPGVQPGVLALVPGTTVGAPNGCANPGPVAIALTSWGYPDGGPLQDKNQVLLYDSNFCRIGELGVANDSNETGPGIFFLAGAPAFGPAGEIYVAGYQENKIEVFLPDASVPGGYVRGLGINTGEANTTVTDANGLTVNLAGPYGLIVESRGRLVVSDANNNRIAVFLQPWHPDNTSPKDPVTGLGTQWQFAFQLVAQGQLSGAYLAMVREDSFGRWLASSVVFDVIYVFEIPELAVVQAEAEEVVATANGDVIRVRGNIVVPVGKSALTAVIPMIEHDADDPASNRASLGAVLGPFLASPDVDVFNPSYEGTPILEIDEIQPGRYAQVYWDYPVQSDGQAQFTISAMKITGLADDIVAEGKIAAAETVPGTCVAPVLHVPVFSRPAFPTVDAATGLPTDVYGDPVTVTFSASQTPEGVREIRYEYLEGLLNGQSGVLSGSNGALTITHGFPSSLMWTIRYRAVANCGALTAWTTLRFKVDAEAPRLFFGPVTPAPSGTDPDNRKWHSAASVTMRVEASDDDTFSENVVFPDYPAVQDGILDVAFTNEGGGQRELIRVQDPVGNEFAEFTTRLSEINIDRTAPALTLQAVTSANANGWYRGDVTFDAVAEDFLSGVNTLTSPDGLTISSGATRNRVTGVTILGGEGSALTASAMSTDFANNSRTVTSPPVNIDRTLPVANAVTDPSQVYTGQVTVTLAATDDAATPGATPSGVANIFYSVSGGPAQQYGAPFVIAAPGANVVEIWATDRADNVGTRRTVIYSVNSAPTVSNASLTTAEDVPVNVAVSAADADGDSLSYTVVAQPAHGIATLDAGTGAGSYSPNLNYFGPDSFTVRVSDGRGGSSTATISITVSPMNDAPTAAALVASTIETDPVAITPVYADADPGDTLTVSLAAGAGNAAAQGVVVQSGAVFIYTANAGFIGSDTFKYVVTDAAGASAMATVVVNVRQRNQAPTCGAAAVTPGLIWPVNHRQVPLAITGILDADGDAITVSVTRILQDEPTQTVGDGNTAVDGGGLGTSTPWVRAERMGPQSDRTYNNGRLYEIFFIASDGRGGSCEGKVSVGVPHDQGRGSTVIDNGCRWDSVAGGPVLSCAPGAQPPVPTRRRR